MRRLTQVEVKPWYESKTVWFNVLTFLVLVLTSPAVLNLFPTDVTAAIASVVAILNIALRFFTNSPVTPSPAEPDKPLE